MKKKVFVDASSAILLFKSELFSRLTAAYRVWMTPVVYSEVTVSGHIGADYFSRVKSSGEFHVSAPGSWFPPGEDDDIPALDPGEKETIACYHHNRGDFLLIDDGKAARYCRRSGIPYINALLLARILHLDGILSDNAYRGGFQTLCEIGWYSPEIVRIAQQLPRDRLHRFKP